MCRSSALTAALISAVLAAPAAMTSAEARADEGGASGLGKVRAVENRRFTNDGRWEIAAFGSFAPVSRLVRSGAVGLSAGWNFSETLSVSLSGAWGIHKTTAAFDDARESIQSSDPKVRFRIADDLSDAWAPDWAVLAALRWMPVYGKLSLFSAAAPRFGFFVRVSGGLGGFSKESAVSDALDDSALKPLFSLGAGLRFYLSRRISLDLSAAALLFPDSYQTGVDRTLPESTGETKRGVTCIATGTLALVFSI